jgi:hypothetical protein
VGPKRRCKTPGIAESLRRLSQRGCRRQLARDHRWPAVRLRLFVGDLSARARDVIRAPLTGGRLPLPPEGKLRVYRSRNAGESWEALPKGLPQEHAFVRIYREGMATDRLDSVGIHIGTNTGKIFASNDEGDSWYTLANHLPPVYAVSASVVE